MKLSPTQQKAIANIKANEGSNGVASADNVATATLAVLYRLGVIVFHHSREASFTRRRGQGRTRWYQRVTYQNVWVTITDKGKEVLARSQP